MVAKSTSACLSGRVIFALWTFSCGQRYLSVSVAELPTEKHTLMKGGVIVVSVNRVS